MPYAPIAYVVRHIIDFVIEVFMVARERRPTIRYAKPTIAGHTVRHTRQCVRARTCAATWASVDQVALLSLSLRCGF
jgi:hypothetical protein